MTVQRFAIFLLIVCGLSAWQVTAIPESPMYAVVGATFIPTIIVSLLCLCGVLYGVEVFKGGAVDLALDEESSPVDGAPARAAYFLAGLFCFVIFIKPLGFVLAAVFSGVAIARSFDASVGVRSLLICSGISIFFWVLFDLLLSVDLGPLFPLSSK
jgi:putative tricarboxylic transport membrane protein